MADWPGALHGTRARLSSQGKRWIGALVAAPAAVHAYSGFCLLPFCKGTYIQWACGDFLRLAAHGSRSRAIPHCAGGKVAQSDRSIHALRPRRDLMMVGSDTRTSSIRGI